MQFCGANLANSAKNKVILMGAGIRQLAEKATIKKQRHETDY